MSVWTTKLPAGASGQPCGTTPAIEAVRDAVQRGYASAGVVIKPWTIYVDGKLLADKRGRPRRFATERAAMAAGRRSIA